MESINNYDVINEAKNIVEGILNDYDIPQIIELEELIAKYHSIKDTADDDTLESLFADIESAKAMDPYGIDIYDYLHEVIDGHQWVIYYHSAWQVMSCMRNDDTTVDQFKQLSDGMEFTDLDRVATIYAYSALFGHAVNELDNVLDYYIDKLCAGVLSVKNSALP